VNPHRQRREDNRLIPAVGFAGGRRPKAVRDLQRGDVDVLTEEVFAEEPHPVFPLEVSPGRVLDVFVRRAGEHFEGRQCQRRRLELLCIGRDLCPVVFGHPARQRERELLTDQDGVFVGVPPTLDRLGDGARRGRRPLGV
jgi:hypothetical protein